MKDILLNDDWDLDAVDGDFVIGESITQEVAVNLSLSQGTLKSSPLLGPNLVQKMKGSGQDLEIKKSVKISLEMDDMDYEEIKNSININAKG